MSSNNKESIHAAKGKLGGRRIDAVMGIQEGRNPRIIEDMLRNYLPSSRRSEEREAA